jgi:hypothetical protein
MGFPKLGATLTVEHNGVKITGKMTKIRPNDQTVFIDCGNDTGAWVAMKLIRAKYGK